MTPRSNLFLSAFLALFLLTGTTAVTVAVTTEVAEAARFGGGKSFGGKSFMKRPAQQPAVNRQQATQQQPGAAAAAPAARSGMFGGMGGMLGGLLAGSLLGSMLFGGGMAGGGFLDILIFGGLLFLLFKFLARRKAASAAAGAGMTGNAAMSGSPNASTQAYQQAGPTPGGMSWERLAGGSPASDPQPVAPSPTASNIPADFNQQEFLEGAKAAYARLNTAWDKRDLADIGQFATPAFMDEIRAQAEADPTPSSTEIMLVNANMVEVVNEGDEQMASVFFDVLLRESSAQTAPQDVREIWHFVRNADGSGMWRVDGIQQVN